MNAIRHLRNNLGTAVLSLSLGFVIWIAATLQNDAFETRDFVGVPISIVNQPQDTVFVDPLQERALITVRAQSSVLAEFSVADLAAIIDLKDVAAGATVSVPVEVSSSNEAARVVAVDPEQQVVYLESIISDTMPVTIDVAGQVPQGYRSETPLVTPEAVVIRGAQSDVLVVAQLVSSVDVEGAREDIVERVPVIAVDVDGNIVPGVELAPSDVEVEVGVRRRVGYKPDVEVVPDLLGDPAAGYRLGSVQVEPQTVTLAGLPSVLEGLPGFVETLPISVTGATADLSVRTGLTLPSGVAVYGENTVIVTVQVFPIQSSRAMTATVDVQDVRPGWLATPSPGVVDVILEGANTILAGFTSNDLQVIVDVDGYPLGVHRVEPDVVAPEGITVVSVIPETIEVVLAVAPTVTPTQTMTPTQTTTPTGTVEP